MNHIFKVIWSRVKHAYIVVSEITNSCGKSSGKRIVVHGKEVLAELLAVMVLTSGGGFVASAHSIQITGVSSGTAAATQDSKGIGTYLYNYNNPGNSIDLTDTGTPKTGNYSSLLFYGVSLGTGTSIDGGSNEFAGIAIGDYAHATGGLSMAMGIDSHATDIAAVAIGTAALASGFNSLALMRQSAATGAFSTAIGTASYAAADGSFAMGNSATAKGVRSIAIGAAAMEEITTNRRPKADYDSVNNTQSLGDRSIAIGSKARTNEGAADSLALGSNATAVGINSFAIGSNSSAGVSKDSGDSVAIGVGTEANATDTVAIGSSATASIDNGVVIGYKATATAQGAMAIGANASSAANNSLALGADTTIAAITSNTKAAITGVTNKDQTNGVIAVASGADTARRIVGVAGGSADTDAVNVSQLQAVEDSTVHYDKDSAGNINKNSVTLNPGGTGSTTITNLAAGINDTDAVNVTQLKAAKTEVKQGANVTVTSDTDKTDSHMIYTVAADDMRVKSGTASYDTNGTGSIAVTNNDGTTATISGLKNTYTASGTLSGTTETFTRNDGTSYDVNLSGLTDSVTNKGLKFGANSGDAVTNKLGSQVNIIGEGSKADGQYSGANIKTKVNQNEDGTTSIDVMMDKNITGDSVTVGSAGKDGAAGVNGTIGVKGADGTDGVTVYATNGTDGTQGHIGLTGVAGKDGQNATADITVANGANGVDGTDGHNGTDGMDRVTYTDHNDVTHEVATMDDGLKFKGDNATVIAKKLNETMDIKGGADSTKLTDGNIGVVAQDGALNVKLAKDLKGLDSVTTGDTVINTNGMTVTNGPTITKTTVDVAGNKITNVKAGDVTSDSTDAVNGSQLKSYTDAAKTEVKQGANVTVTSDTDKSDNHVIYTVSAADMRVKSGTASYGTDGTGSIAVTNNDGTTASITGLKNTYTTSGTLKGTTETFTRNDGTSYDVDLSSLAGGLSDTGLKFGANSGTAVTNKLGSKVTIAGTGTKADTSYSGKNLKTIVSQGDDGNTIINVLMDNDIDANSVKVGKDGTDGTPGKDGVSITGPSGTAGVDGVDGKVGITGADGKDAVSISGKDGVGHIGLTGAKGTDGKDGASADITVKDGNPGVNGADGTTLTRVVYEDKGGTEHQVATLDDGMKYMGDSGTVAKVELNKTVNVVGGVTDQTKLSDNNIGVVSAQDGENGKLTVKLAKDLKNLDSVTTGDTVINTNGMTITGGPTITKTTVDVAGNKITNVADGDVTSTSTDAINGSQLKKFTDAATTKVTKGNNTTVNSTRNTDGSTTYTVDLANTITVGNTNPVTVNGTDGIVTGLTNTDWNNGAPTGYSKDRAATEGELTGVETDLTNKGLKFGANSGTAVTNKLGSQVNVVGAGTKVDEQYSGTNIKTKVSQATDGTTSIDVMMDKNITGDSVTVGSAGKDGAAGVNGTIGVKGADGTDGVTVYATNGTDGTQGHIGLTGEAGKDGQNATADITVANGANGVDGTDGHNGTDGMDRVTYTDHNDVTHEVATMDDGLKFKGDNATVIAKKLNETMDIKGGADSTKLTEGNIGVVAQDGALNVKLAKDLKGLDSVTTGDTVINTNGMTVTNGPTITKTTVDVAGNKITNVKAGDVTSDSTDAVNGSQLKKYTDAAKTEVRAGSNVDSVTLQNDDNDKHAIYTVNVKDMTVKSGSVTYGNDGTGTATLTNGNGTTATITGLKNTYTTSGTLKGTTETFTRNDGTNYDVDLSSLAGGLSDTGLKFGANSGTAVTNKLGSKVTIAGTGTKADTSYSGKNLKTIVSQGDDGNTTINVLMDNDIDANSVKVGKDGTDGTPGKDGVSITGPSGTAGVDGEDGKVGITGADGKDAVSISGKDGVGHIGLTGAKGTDGKDGASADITVKDGDPGVNGADGTTLTRVVYEDKGGTEHQVATLDDGMKYMGDSGTVAKVELNKTVNVVGGVTDQTKLSDNNIGVVSAQDGENGKLTVKLAKDLKNLDSVTTGDTVINTNGMTITGGPTITKTTVDVAGNKITNVADGDVTSISTDAINGSQLKKFTDAATTKVTNGNNTTVNSTKNTDGSTTYTVDLANTITVGDTHPVTVNGTDGTVTGLTNTDWNNGAPTGYSKDRAATEGELTGVETDLTNKGLKFGANSGTAVTNKLGSQVTIAGAGTKADTSYSGKNLKTIVSQGDDGNTTINVLMDNDIDANSVKVGKDGTDGTPGKDGVSITGPSGTAGVDGVDGKVGITGADGKDAVSISGKDGVGHIGLTGAKGTDGKDGASADITVANGANGVDGTDGHDGTNGMDRVTYTDHNDVTHEVATMDDGLKFKGDNATVIAKKLNETMDIKGGADSTKLTDGNIGVVAQDGALNVKLAKDLKGLDSVTTGDTVINTNGVTVTNGPTITKTTVDVAGNKITNVKAGDVTSDSTDAVNGSQLKKYTDAAKTEVRAGSNVDSVTLQNDDNDKHAIYTVNVKDMTVKSGSVTYGNDGTGTATLTNGNGTTATITGLKNTYTTSGTLNGTKETFTRNDGTSYDVDLSSLSGDLSNKGLQFAANSGDTVTNKLGSKVTIAGTGTKADTSYSGKNLKTVVSQDEDGNTTINVLMDNDIDANSVKVGKDGADGTPGKDGVSITGPSGTAGVDGVDGKVGITGADGKDAVSISGKDGVGHIGLTGAKGTDGKDGASADITVANGANGVDGTDGHDGKDGMDRVTYTDHNDVTHEVATMDDGLKFKGDNATVIAKKLNETMDIKGGADSTKLTDGNIGVVGENGALNVKLAKDLKGLDSVTTGDTVINTNGMTVTNGPTITKITVDVAGNKITNVKAGDVTSDSTDAVNGSQLKSYTDAAKTEVKQGANVTVTSDTDKSDNHVIYTVSAADMRVKSGTASYGTDGTGSIAVTNNDGTTASITGLKNTYTASGTLKGTTETFTRNDGTSYDVDLSALTESVTNKGLNFGANSGNTVTNKLGSTVNVVGEGTKADTEYSGTNIKTKVSQKADGTTSLEVMLDKNITGDSVTVGGKDGKDGVNGTIGVKGADGKDGVNAYATNGTNGTEGHIGLTGLAGIDGKDAKADITVKEGKVGVDGTDGKNGKDGMDRVEYTDHNNTTHEVATLDDGLKFKGDGEETIAKKLNETLAINGGADSTNLSDNNIGVVVKDGTLNVKLAKDLTGLTSVTTGDTTMNTDGITIKNGPTITKTVVDTAGNKVTNVKDGDINKDSKDAVNGSQLYNATKDLTDEGLKFGANSGTTVTNKLGSTVNVVGEGTKADSEYSGTNIKTKVSQKADGTTSLEVMMDKNITGDSVTVGGAGKDGASGVDGSIGVKGTDGTDGVTVYATNGTDGKDGTEGHIGLTGVKGTDGQDAKADITVKEGKVGVDGTDGKNGKDGMDRVEYTDHNDVTHEVATLDDGMKYGGDIGNTIALKLNSQLNVKGGISDATKLTDNNIGVVSDGTGTLTVKLAKDLKGLTSTTYVDENGQLGTTINNKGVTIENGDHDVSLTKNGLDNGGNTITNVAKGVNGTDAVNVDQLKEETAKATTKVADGTNTNVTSETNKDGSTTYHVNLNPSITLGTDPTKQVSIDGTKGTITAGTGDKAVSIDGTTGTVQAGKVKVDGTEGTVTGLTNKTWIPGTTTAVSGRAATEDQLKSVSDVAYNASKQHTTVENKDGNITVEQGTNVNGGINYTLGLKDNINVGGKTGKDGSIGVNGKDGSNGVTLSAKTGNDGVEGHIGLTGAKGADGTSTTADIHVIAGQAGVNGKDGDTMTRVVYEDKDKTTHEIATTDDGMKYSGDTGSAAVKLDKNVSIVGETTSGTNLTTGNIGVEASQDGDNAKLVVKLSDNLTGIKNITTENVNATTVNATTVNAGDTVTINNNGIDMGGTKITNVKKGDITASSTDAVNGSQLYQTNKALTNLGNSVGELDNRVDKVGAGAAALAALHPLDFDPDDKWDFAAGYGNYRGANAAAVGAFYRPNEDTMFSIGGSIGNGENMINAGVSFKLGQGNHVSTSRVAMAKEIKDLHKEIEGLRSALVNMSQGQRLDMTKMKLFPDIPANHWAYEAIKTLAGNGIVEGYPDGNFSGDRMMTRYEFSMIVYRAMQKGADVNAKLLNEFEPELERIRVDTIEKDKNGNPTIQRVRVIPGRG